VLFESSYHGSAEFQFGATDRCVGCVLLLVPIKIPRGELQSFQFNVSFLT